MGTLTQPGVAAQFPMVGRWSVTGIPQGWIYVAGFGIRQMRMDGGKVAASVGVGNDKLDAQDGFAAYVEKQMKLIAGHFNEAKLAGPQPISFAGAESAQLLFVRHKLDEVGTMLHAQTYVQSGLWLGIITLTTLEDQLKAARPDYDVFVKGLRIRSEQANDQGTRA